MSWCGRDTPLAPYQTGPEPALSSHLLLPGRGDCLKPSSSSPTLSSTSFSPSLAVGSGLSGTSLQGSRMSKFLSYSWGLDFYHPSILVNSERPTARNARELRARPTKPKITPHVPLSSPQGFGHFGCMFSYKAAPLAL